MALSVCLSVCPSVGRSVCLQKILKNSKSRFGDYITVVYALNNTYLIIVLYRNDRLVGQSVGWLVGWLVGQSVSWLVCWSFFKILRFGEYVAIVYTLINTLLIIVLYRHGIKCAITKVKHIVELKDRVLVPWGPSSISAVAELLLLQC